MNLLLLHGGEHTETASPGLFFGPGVLVLVLVLIFVIAVALRTWMGGGRD